MSNKALVKSFCKQSYNPLALQLMEGLSKGKVCRAKWIMKDGGVREANLRLWSKSGITYYPEVRENPVIHTGKYITCEDISKKALTGGCNKGWVNVTIDSLTEVKVEGVVSTFILLFKSALY